MLQVDTQDHAIVSRTEWTTARRSLLVREKAATRLRDTSRAERMALPWVEVDRAYRFGEYNFTSTQAAQANDELPGLSAFYRRDDGRIFHTYSAYARGGEELIGTLMILDFAPKGRNESKTMDFVRRHDEYDQAPAASSCCS